MDLTALLTAGVVTGITAGGIAKYCQSRARPNPPELFEGLRKPVCPIPRPWAMMPNDLPPGIRDPIKYIENLPNVYPHYMQLDYIIRNWSPPATATETQKALWKRMEAYLAKVCRSKYDNILRLSLKDAHKWNRQAGDLWVSLTPLPSATCFNKDLKRWKSARTAVLSQIETFTTRSLFQGANEMAKLQKASQRWTPSEVAMVQQSVNHSAIQPEPEGALTSIDDWVVYYYYLSRWSKLQNALQEQVDRAQQPHRVTRTRGHRRARNANRDPNNPVIRIQKA